MNKLRYAHPKEMVDRPCPNGWAECAVCKHEIDCRAGLYKGEEDILLIAAEICEKSVMVEAKESARSIKRDLHQEFMAMTHEESMNWFYSNKVQGLHHKEPIPQDGPSTPGSGGKCKVPPKPAWKMPEYLKNWGQSN